MPNPLFRNKKREAVEEATNGAAAGVDEPSTTYRSFSSIAQQQQQQQRSTAQDDPLAMASDNDQDDGDTAASKDSTIATPPAAAGSTNHRGFSTSIGDMFGHLSYQQNNLLSATTTTDNNDNVLYEQYYYPHERTDCCAMACCGMLQSDRDRFLMTGVLPPGPMKRLTVHIALPCCIFFLAGLGAIHISDPVLNQTVCTALVLVLFYYLILQCCKGRHKRLQIRKDLLFTKYQILHQQQQQSDSNDDDAHLNVSLALEQERPDDEDDDGNAYYYLGQTPWDFACAHPCCMVGLYAEDRPTLTSTTAVNNNNNNNDMCHWMWKHLFPSPICGMHVQCCGVCAIAQEAREVERAVLPAIYRRIDYITMQPVTEYYPAIYRAKWMNQALLQSSNTAAGQQPQATVEQQESFLSDTDSITDTTGVLNTFPPPLSRLSYRLFQWLGIYLACCLAWAILRPLYWKITMQDQMHRNAFNLYDFMILILVFLQAGVTTAILAWFTNGPKYSALSLDAMIKCFASGFLLSTSLAVFWEYLLGLIIQMVVALALALEGVDVVDDPDYSGAVRTSTASASSSASQQQSSSLWSTGAGGADLLPPEAWGSSNPISAAASQDFVQSYGRDHPFWFTIVLLVKAFIVAALVEEVCKYFGYRMCDDHPDFLTRNDLIQASQVVFAETEDQAHEQQDQRRRRRGRRRENSYSHQLQSYQAHGAAITLAMLCAAMGFCCCENLVYVFWYSAASPFQELFVLIFRSFFPIHPICAALQSIHVTQRQVEDTVPPRLPRRATLGRIVLPAVLFHGSYDFFVVWINFLATRHKSVYNNNDEDAASAANGVIVVDVTVVAMIVSFVISVTLIVTAITYYLQQARKQRQRLIDMDEQAARERSRLI